MTAYEGGGRMPIFEYQAVNPEAGCEQCKGRFEVLVRSSDPPVTACPCCGNAVRKLISAAAVGASKSGLDQRAKSAGFHKLQKLGKGEYEKQY